MILKIIFIVRVKIAAASIKSTAQMVAVFTPAVSKVTFAFR